MLGATLVLLVPLAVGAGLLCWSFQGGKPSWQGLWKTAKASFLFMFAAMLVFFLIRDLSKDSISTPEQIFHLWISVCSEAVVASFFTTLGLRAFRTHLAFSDWLGWRGVLGVVCIASTLVGLSVASLLTSA